MTYTHTQVDFSEQCMHILLVVYIGRHQKRDHGNYDQFAPNSDMACRTIQRVSVPDLKSFEPIETELWAKEVREISIM